MMRLIILYLLLFPCSGFAQNYINKPRTQVKKELNEYIAKNNSLNATINETDSMIVLVIKGPDTLPADFIYRFDKEGKCKSEKVVANCDSCYNKYLQSALSKKKYGWKKINENQYISNYTDKMLIELPANGKDLFFIILRTDWSKQMYDLLKGE